LLKKELSSLSTRKTVSKIKSIKMTNARIKSKRSIVMIALMITILTSSRSVAVVRVNGFIQRERAKFIDTETKERFVAIGANAFALLYDAFGRSPTAIERSSMAEVYNLRFSSTARRTLKG
jgi:hypothetical protein